MRLMIVLEGGNVLGCFSPDPELSDLVIIVKDIDEDAEDEIRISSKEVQPVTHQQWADEIARNEKEEDEENESRDEDPMEAPEGKLPGSGIPSE
jgi:hypothetical protein